MTLFIVLLALAGLGAVAWYAHDRRAASGGREKTLDELVSGDTSAGQPRPAVHPVPSPRGMPSIVTAQLVGSALSSPSDRPLQEYFMVAFDHLLVQLDGDTKGMRELAPLLISEAMSGNHYRGREWLMKELPHDSWRWPEFERQWGERQQSAYAAALVNIQVMADSQVLDALRMQDLRKLAAGRAKGRGKQDLIEALKTNLPGEDLLALISQGRQLLMDALPDPYKFDYAEQCEVFIHRLSALAYSKRNLEELRESPVLDQMKAVFRAGGTMNTPKTCILRNGQTYALNDPELGTLAPCGRLDCSCLISTVIEGWRRNV